MKAAQAPLKAGTAWAMYFIVLATLCVVVGVSLMVTWPRPWDMFVANVLLREAGPSAWRSTPTPASVAGCYAVSFSRCVLNDPTGTCLARAPRAIELTLKPHRRLVGAYLVGTDGEPAVGPSAWSITPRNTVAVSLSNGFSGLSLELGPAAAGLAGTASTWTDTTSTSQWAVVHAPRVECHGAGD